MQLQDLRKRVHETDTMRERYWIATLFLSTILVLALGIIVNRQFELDSVKVSLENCNGERVKLVASSSVCGEKQLQELEKLRADLLEMAEVKGKCLVFEKNLKEKMSEEKNSTALIMKQVDDLVLLMAKHDESTAKATAKKEQLLHNITVLAQERQKYFMMSESCSEKLIACEQKNAG